MAKVLKEGSFWGTGETLARVGTLDEFPHPVARTLSESGLQKQAAGRDNRPRR
jgi:hypothetical protein